MFLIWQFCYYYYYNNVYYETRAKKVLLFVTAVNYTPLLLFQSACPSRSWVSSGSIVSDYGLDDRAIGVRFPAEAKDFSSSLCVQTVSGAHPASCPMGTGGTFPGGKSAAGA
jgi:hypothetical protein